MYLNLRMELLFFKFHFVLAFPLLSTSSSLPSTAAGDTPGRTCITLKKLLIKNKGVCLGSLEVTAPVCTWPGRSGELFSATRHGTRGRRGWLNGAMQPAAGAGEGGVEPLMGENIVGYSKDKSAHGSKSAQDIGCTREKRLVCCALRSCCLPRAPLSPPQENCAPLNPKKPLIDYWGSTMRVDKPNAFADSVSTAAFFFFDALVRSCLYYCSTALPPPHLHSFPPPSSPSLPPAHTRTRYRATGGSGSTRTIAARWNGTGTPHSSWEGVKSTHRRSPVMHCTSVGADDGISS